MRLLSSSSSARLPEAGSATRCGLPSTRGSGAGPGPSTFGTLMFAPAMSCRGSRTTAAFHGHRVCPSGFIAWGKSAIRRAGAISLICQPSAKNVKRIRPNSRGPPRFCFARCAASHALASQTSTTLASMMMTKPGCSSRALAMTVAGVFCRRPSAPTRQTSMPATASTDPRMRMPRRTDRARTWPRPGTRSESSAAAQGGTREGRSGFCFFCLFFMPVPPCARRRCAGRPRRRSP